MWIDPHAHLDTFIEDGSWEAVRARATAAGVETIIAIGGTTAANEQAVALAQQDNTIYAVVGFDRDEATTGSDWPSLQRAAAMPRVVGVGETGLDYHYSRETAAAQRTLLEQNLAWAREVDLPVVIHTREADTDTVDLLRAHVAARSAVTTEPGVIHCFTGDAPFARRLLDLGFMISFSGIVTFKKSDELRTVLRTIPLDRLLIETDAPYLAPVPQRGRRNEPAYVAHVGTFVAAELGVAESELAARTAANARRLFRLESA